MRACANARGNRKHDKLFDQQSIRLRHTLLSLPFARGLLSAISSAAIAWSILASVGSVIRRYCRLNRFAHFSNDFDGRPKQVIEFRLL